MEKYNSSWIKLGRKGGWESVANSRVEGGGGVVVVVTSWSEVEFVGNGKKRHHEVRRASERITNHKNCMKLLS